jgi:hypothetical protein
VSRLELAISAPKWRLWASLYLGDYRMRTLLVAALFTAIAIPAAHAQAMGTGIPLNQEKEVSPEVREKRRAQEEAYRSTIKNIPDAKPVDPWGSMRGTDTSGNATKAKPAKKSGGNLAN